MFIKQKYWSEEWFNNISDVNRLSIKEALKLSLIEPLEDLLGKNLDVNSSFRVSLIYNHIGLLQEFDIEDLEENNAKRGETEKVCCCSMGFTFSFW